MRRLSPSSVAPSLQSLLPQAPAFLSGGGEMGALIRGHDWAASSLGLPSAWPQSLKTAVQLLLNTGHPMYLFWGPDGRCLYNDAYRQSLGPERHPGSLGQPATQVWEEIWPNIGPQIEQVMAGRGATWHVNQLLSITRNGRREDVYWTYSYGPIGDDAAPNGVGGVVVMCSETTAAVLGEKRLAKEVERQRKLFMAAPGFITILDGPDHVFEFVNDSYRRLSGERDFLGRAAREVYPELEGQGFFELLDEVYTTGTRHVAHDQPIRLAIGPDGALEERILDFIYEPVVDDQGRVTGIFCEGFDVTATGRAESALHDSEEALRDVNAMLQAEVAARTRERNLLGKLVETADAMMMALDLDFEVLALNHATANHIERVYGGRPAVGSDLLKLFAAHPEHQRQVRLDWAPAMRGEASTLVDQFDPAQPDRRCYETRFCPLHDDGILIGAYKFVYDITDRERGAARLAQAQEALLQAQKLEAMGQLTGGVAHDFNNLLTPIIGGLDMLQRRSSGDAREMRLIGGALQSAERARVLVQRLLAFARRQPLQPVPVDIGALLTGMTDLIRDSIGVNISVALDVAEALPPAIVDPGQLELAVLNLCVNARDAMPGGGSIELAVSAESIAANVANEPAAGRYVRLSVTDTGRGMDEPTRLRAVEPFFSTKGVGKGTGLGLSMAHGLASQLGGALTIISRYGHGTTVNLWLPVSNDASPFIELRAPHAGTATFGGKVALVVDDDDGVRLSTADMLGELGFTVRQAASGAAALAALDRGLSVDVIVTDHLMPGMTGGELAAVLRLTRPLLPVLIVSGFAEHAGIDPAVPRLAKPFRRAELAQSLAELRLDSAATDHC